MLFRNVSESAWRLALGQTLGACGRKLLLFLAALSFLVPAFAAGHVPGRLLVQTTRVPDARSIHRTLAMHGLTVRGFIEPLGVAVLQGSERSLDSVAETLRKSGQFTFVERDGVATGGGTPNDPYFPSQWHLAKVRAADAWNITAGTPGVTIAMIDSGVDASHPDLAGKLTPGWSFLSSTADTRDVQGHGTATAGTAAAATDNGIGGAGLAANNLIMPLVVLDSNDYAAYSDIASAIAYAVDHGVRIINISIGGASPSNTLQRAVDYAWAHGAVIFASAMNQGNATPYYPAACDHVVAVSATEPDDTLAPFSNYGSWVTLSAPGDNIFTTMKGGGYGNWFGTSFASPLVAATAALVLSVHPALTASDLVSLLEHSSDDLGAAGYDPYFGWGRVNAYRALTAAAGMPGTQVTGLSSAQVPTAASTQVPSVAVTSPLDGSHVGGLITVTVDATGSPAVTQVGIYIDHVLRSTLTSPPYSYQWRAARSLSGGHTIYAKAWDAAGNVGISAPITVHHAAGADAAKASLMTVLE